MIQNVEQIETMKNFQGDEIHFYAAEGDIDGIGPVDAVDAETGVIVNLFRNLDAATAYYYKRGFRF